jgi:uncharacterized protein (TIGR00369 family)
MIKKQPSSRHCFLCGIENPIGLKLSFYEDAENRVSARFVPGEEHQGYPGMMHGGITCALLDETIGRTLVRDDIWAMTVDLKVRFRAPIPLGRPLTVVGEMVRLRSRTMEGQGQIVLEDGTVAATAEATYIRLSDEQVDAFRAELGYWQVVPEQDGGDGENR